jgi:hypothetical protein
MKIIYILLTRTNTLFSQIVHLLTKAEYTHAAISLNNEMTCVYSFARRYANNPFCIRFMREDISHGVYARNNGTPCAVYALTVSDIAYSNIKNQIETMFNEKQSYRYNYRGVIANYLGKEHKFPRHYFCSEFVSKILIKAGVLHTKKSPCMIRPMDFTQMTQMKMVYSGNTKDLMSFPRRNIKEVRKCFKTITQQLLNA